ncbi:type II secretion system F family protein [Actinophytocola sp. NPDC049390]|uniref:type II secretion system F family protein n=1 Tax=Actinophytocola sp. NPDC049390 TaxID=3363894 RepID=UPI0037978249
MTTPTSAWGAVLGVGLGLGACLIALGCRTRHSEQHRRSRERRDGRRLAAAAVAGVAAGVVTEWVVAAVLVGVAAWCVPAFLARNREQARQVARIEAIAGWAELLRDTLAGAAGLEQAILASAPVAPAAIHPEINALALRLEAGQRLAPSLQQLGDDLADPTADLVIAALHLAATQHARNLGDLLGSLAAAARDLASMRLRIDAGRARTRTSVRIIIATTTAFAGLLVTFNRGYLAAYDTVTGQLVLALVGSLFAAGYAGLVKITAVTPPARLLAPATPLTGGGA